MHRIQGSVPLSSNCTGVKNLHHWYYAASLSVVRQHHIFAIYA